jgi:hypothetical protein
LEMISSDILNLTQLRYVPWVIEGTSLGVWYDTGEGQYRVLCPQCGCLITCETIEIVYREMVLSERKGCQGCRAKISFEKNPRVTGLFLDFWCRTGNFPESPSWLKAVPQKQFNLLGKINPIRSGDKSFPTEER